MAKDQMALCFDAMKEVLRCNSDTLFDDQSMAHCKVHGRRCHLYQQGTAHVDEAQPITVMWGGHPCLDETSMGLRAGHNGPQAAALLVWIAEARRRKWTLLWHECTPEFDPIVFVDELGDIYEVLSV